MMPPTGPSHQPSLARRALEVALILAVILATLHRALRPGHVVGDGVDLFGTLWMYGHVAGALAAGTPLLHTDAIFYPDGKDLFAETGGNVLDAVLAAPLVWALGSPTFHPVAALLVLLANAFAFRGLARHVLRSPDAALAATLAFLLNPYLALELSCGRLTQATLAFAPLALLAFLRASEPGRPGVAAAALAGLCVAAQATIYWYMGYFLALGMLPLAVAAIRRHPTPGALAARYGLAALVCFVCTGPWIAAMAAVEAAGRVPGLPPVEVSLWELPPRLGNNLPSTLLGLGFFETHGPPLVGTPSWGLAVLASLVFLRGSGWPALVALTLLFAVGPGVPLGEEAVVLPWYMAAWKWVPFLDRLWYPYRLLSVTFIGVALGLGAAFTAVQARRGPRVAWAALAGVLAWGAADLHRYALWPVTATEVRTPALLRWMAASPGERGAVLHLPFGIQHAALAWQPTHGLPLFGGMAEAAPTFWPPDLKRRLRQPLIKALVTAPAPTPRDAAPTGPEHRAEALGLGLRWVVLHRELLDHGLRSQARREGTDLTPAQLEDHVSRVTARLVGHLGPPTAAEGPLLAWDLARQSTPPPALAATEADLDDRTWAFAPLPPWEQVLVDRGRR